jgi:hypothetical protein
MDTDGTSLTFDPDEEVAVDEDGLESEDDTPSSLDYEALHDDAC